MTTDTTLLNGALLNGLRALQIGTGLAAAACGRAMADLGADIHRLGPDTTTPLAAYLNHGGVGAALTPETLADEAKAAAIIICEGRPSDLHAHGLDQDRLRALNPTAVLVYISPFGQTGPWANRPATDLTLFAASGISQMLTGQVTDLSEPPTRPVGEQSAFIGGLAAACAAMHASLLDDGQPGAVIDISLHEALATLAIAELTRAGLNGKAWSRERIGDGNGATVCILPASDGFVAISPREEKQWAVWLTVMGSPDWSAEARFKTKPDRAKNWDALHALMSEWSQGFTKQWIADAAQEAHVPSFPLRELTEHFDSAQLEQRSFYRTVNLDGKTLQAPGLAYGLSPTGAATRPAPIGDGPLPLSGVRVLDFSWVIAGPTTTRHLAAMGADIIKVEAPGRGDPGRASELHTVLGQGKRAIVLNLKSQEAVDIAQRLAGECDILIENFGTGVMERFGLGAKELCAANPNLLYMSASGLGRTGPEAGAVAYGTLLQCYAGFAGLNGQPDAAPRVGFAWLDPMCGLKIAFAAAAWIWNRKAGGGGARIDYSMIEALLWTLAEPILAAQLGDAPKPEGNASARYAPHGVYPAKGKDQWIALAIETNEQWRALCGLVLGLAEMAELDEAGRRAAGDDIDAILSNWTNTQLGSDIADILTSAGIPASPVANSLDLVACEHLRARDFWEDHERGVMPGLPWQASFGRQSGPAPDLGADTGAVLREVLSLSDTEIETLRGLGALG
jgi:crotonobetainyl-CoA:carnitine CoA-transferase CaiB-like acyl-CoA transferase